MKACRTHRIQSIHNDSESSTKPPFPSPFGCLYIEHAMQNFYDDTKYMSVPIRPLYDNALAMQYCNIITNFAIFLNNGILQFYFWKNALFDLHYYFLGILDLKKIKYVINIFRGGCNFTSHYLD